jgi:hypothetical protein
MKQNNRQTLKGVKMKTTLETSVDENYTFPKIYNLLDFTKKVENDEIIVLSKYAVRK